MMRKNQSLSKQISYMTLAMLIFGMLALSVFALALFLADSVDFNAERALAIADSVAAAIDPEEFVNIMADREKTDYWYGVKAFADSVKIRTGVKYLYVLENGSGDRMTYFMEGYNKDTDTEDELDLGAQEDSGIYDAKMFEALSAGTRTKSGIYPSGDFGYMVSGFSPIVNETGRILGVVGVDLQIGEVLTDSLVFGIQMVAGILLFSLICVLVTRRLVNRRLAVPVGALTEASRKIALGDMDISIPAFTGNEIGRLADSFREMADSTKKQVLILEALAEGDLTVKAVPRSSRDVMGNAMAKTISNLSETFRVMQDGIAGVSSGAAGIAKGTEVLAQGSAKQSAAIERLSASVSEVAGRTKDNARLAGTAAELAGQIKTGAEKGAEQMNLMVQAVKEINEASQAIGNVINTIDDIARQTNLLALNASVEAARAGQHGKGFAVVADEVRNLAAKSAEAAKGTAALIDRTVEKTALGVRIAGDTAATFAEIVDGINESSRIVTGIAASSGEQSASITDINSGIEQVSIVVQQNTAVSAESADAAGHMSSQAINLQAFAGRFKLPPS